MNPENPEVEAALITVLQQSGNIDTFVDTFFNFLARRTDFFIECPEEGGRYGFRKGHAESLVRSKFKKWQEINKPENEQKNSSPNPNQSEEQDKLAALRLEENSSKIKPSGKLQVSNSNDAHNGRVTEKYSWSQSITEVDVKIPVPQGILKGKQVKVVIETNRLMVSLVGEDTPLVDGKLTFTVKKDDCYWNLVPGEAIRIWLQKGQERWWQALIEGEELLDMKEIDAVRPMQDLDEEEQMKIQELCWNEERKKQGLPTSEELKMQKVLQEAWNMDGSPFKGQPFDPSVVQIGSQNQWTVIPPQEPNS